jgi:copper oxidase (laccase) domain-containing protein
MTSIKELIDPGFKERTIWVQYLDTFEVELKFLSRFEVTKILEKSKTFIWDKKDHTKIEKLDSEKFYTDLASKVFAGWRGLTQRVLAKMLPVKIIDPDEEIIFSLENLIELMRNAYDFIEFIQNIIMDVERFQSEKKEEEIKNSESSQGG